MKRLAIIGSGDLGQQIAYHAIKDNHYKPIGFFDDIQVSGTQSHNLPILGKINDVLRFFKDGKFDVLMIGLGYRHLNLKEALFSLFVQQIPFGSIIHSSSFVDVSCKIGAGVFIYPGCTLDMNVQIGNNVVINVGCIIAHDSIIGSHSFLSPGVKIAGFVKVGDKVSLGIGSILIDNLVLDSGVRTGGGSVITKNLTIPGLYVGVPAVFKKG